MLIDKGELHAESKEAEFAQQPVDAFAMVLMYHQAFRLTKDKNILLNYFPASCGSWGKMILE